MTVSDKLMEEIVNFLERSNDKAAGCLLDDILEEKTKEAFKYVTLEDFKTNTIVDFICAAKYWEGVRKFLNSNFEYICLIYDIVQKMIMDEENKHEQED